jgi:molecular chaperone DnaK (HSP70)
MCQFKILNNSNGGDVGVGETAESPSVSSLDDTKNGPNQLESSLPPPPPPPSLFNSPSNSPMVEIRRRQKRERQKVWSATHANFPSPTSLKRIVKKKQKSKMASKHSEDSKSGGLDALIPSAIGVVVLIFVIMAKMGFRGRATVAGIDLGTTNSVVCVQAPSKGVGEIVCIPDPATGSPVIPSVVSFLDHHHLRSFRLTKEEKEQNWPTLMPHPVDVVVGQAAKDRIDSHPHHSVYHAKRIIGREYEHESVNSLKGEVDFEIVSQSGLAAIRFPYHTPPSSDSAIADSIQDASTTTAVLSPSGIGAYIISHLKNITRNYLKHDNIKSVVIAIPAKFEPPQRDATVRAYQLAGLKVARILEEPTAAALAYGLHKRDDVHHVLVYDFGGGTLDVSLLYIGDGGNIEVLGSDGDEQLGGADFDAAVARWLLEKQGGDAIVKTISDSVSRIMEGVVRSNSEMVLDIEDLIEASCPKLKNLPLCTLTSLHSIGERMKIGLSRYSNDPGVAVEETCYRLPSVDMKNVPNTADELCETIIKVTFLLTHEEYDLAVNQLYTRSLLPIQRLLQELNLQKEEIDEVVMVGGTTRMPQIRELVRKELNKEKLNTHIDPDLTVAYGAALVLD